VIVAFLAALAAGSSDPAKITENINKVANAPGTQYGPDKLADAIKAVMAGEDIDYIGATGPVDFDANGDPTIALFDVWKATGNGKQDVLSTVTYGK
jgi:ABC-type branched-subunit amino acid transport system substrate-binding protein